MNSEDILQTSFLSIFAKNLELAIFLAGVIIREKKVYNN